MQLGDDDFFHLTYCTNIHPGETWMETFTNLDVYVPALKRALAPEAQFGIGLRLSNRAAEELLEAGHLERFNTWLEAQGLYVFTMNGFPYGGFHHRSVKDDVYRPDWTDRDRVAYTMRLSRILAELVPEGGEGGISTSPVSYKPWHEEAGRRRVFEQASRNLAEVAARLAEMRALSGRFIHIDIEPEPDCFLENTGDTIGFFEEWLLPEGGRYLAETLGMSTTEAHRVLLDHIQVCYDACHFAVVFEEPAYALAKLTGAGLRIGKVQVSSAVKVRFPDDPRERAARLEQVAMLREDTYLHQVVARRPDGGVMRYHDLPQALESGAEAGDEWRIHFHVPIFVDGFGTLASTRSELSSTLQLVRSQRLTSHLEIETYTWEVLPQGLKERLSTSILREYEWALSELVGAPASETTESERKQESG